MIGLGGVQQEEGFGLLLGKGGGVREEKGAGGLCGGNSSQFGKVGWRVTNWKLSKPKLCSQKRGLSFFFGFQVADVTAGKCASLDTPHSFCLIPSFGGFCGNIWWEFGFLRLCGRVSVAAFCYLAREDFPGCSAFTCTAFSGKPSVFSNKWNMWKKIPLFILNEAPPSWIWKSQLTENGRKKAIVHSRDKSKW